MDLFSQIFVVIFGLGLIIYTIINLIKNKQDSLTAVKTVIWFWFVIQFIGIVIFFVQNGFSYNYETLIVWLNLGVFTFALLSIMEFLEISEWAKKNFGL